MTVSCFIHLLQDHQRKRVRQKTLQTVSVKPPVSRPQIPPRTFLASGSPKVGVEAQEETVPQTFQFEARPLVKDESNKSPRASVEVLHFESRPLHDSDAKSPRSHNWTTTQESGPRISPRKGAESFSTDSDPALERRIRLGGRTATFSLGKGRQNNPTSEEEK